MIDAPYRRAWCWRRWLPGGGCCRDILLAHERVATVPAGGDPLAALRSHLSAVGTAVPVELVEGETAQLLGILYPASRDAPRG